VPRKLSVFLFLSFSRNMAKRSLIIPRFRVRESVVTERRFDNFRTGSAESDLGAWRIKNTRKAECLRVKNGKSERKELGFE